MEIMDERMFFFKENKLIPTTKMLRPDASVKAFNFSEANCVWFKCFSSYKRKSSRFIYIYIYGDVNRVALRCVLS